MGFLQARSSVAGVQDSRQSLIVRAGLHPVAFRAFVWAVSVSAAVLTWAWSDVLIWQRIFEANEIFEYDASYQAGHLAVLVGLIAIGSILLLPTGWRWSLAYAAAVYTLACGGAADVLYYWLDGRHIPAALPWLDGDHPLILLHPVTAAGLKASAAVWAALWAFALAGAVSVSVRAARAALRAPAGPRDPAPEAASSRSEESPEAAPRASGVRPVAAYRRGRARTRIHGNGERAFRSSALSSRGRTASGR